MYVEWAFWCVEATQDVVGFNSKGIGPEVCIVFDDEIIAPLDFVFMVCFRWDEEETYPIVYPFSVKCEGPNGELAKESYRIKFPETAIYTKKSFMRKIEPLHLGARIVTAGEYKFTFFDQETTRFELVLAVTILSASARIEE